MVLSVIHTSTRVVQICSSLLLPICSPRSRDLSSRPTTSPPCCLTKVRPSHHHHPNASALTSFCCYCCETLRPHTDSICSYSCPAFSIPSVPRTSQPPGPAQWMPRSIPYNTTVQQKKQNNKQKKQAKEKQNGGWMTVRIVVQSIRDPNAAFIFPFLQARQLLDARLIHSKAKPAQIAHYVCRRERITRKSIKSYQTFQS